MVDVDTPVPEKVSLDGDPRWQLTQRIVTSEGFQRAGQLRALLQYLVTEAILHPGRAIREHELAHQVLGRRGDFDPLTDNIVRAQMSHLRRKLESFYANEGSRESLRVTLPKGAYLPQFREHVADAAPESPAEPPVQPPAPVAHDHLPAKPWRWATGLLAAGCIGLIVLCGSLWLRPRTAAPPRAPVTDANEFVKFLVRMDGSVSIIMPDTSLMLLQNELATDVSVPEYLRPDFLSDQIARQPDPAVRHIMTALRDKHNTSIGESAAAADIVGTLAAHGVSSAIHYARDTHTRDLGEGNAILIGSQRSNPWSKLFSDQLNFRFTRGADPTSFSFTNQKPETGEQASYVPYELQNEKYGSYIDVAVCPNLTHSGYVMLVTGSDMQGNEAAIRFLLHGALPPEVSTLFAKHGLSVYEVFLHSRHAQGEAEENIDVVAVRGTSRP